MFLLISTSFYLSPPPALAPEGVRKTIERHSPMSNEQMNKHHCWAFCRGAMSSVL